MSSAHTHAAMHKAFVSYPAFPKICRNHLAAVKLFVQRYPGSETMTFMSACSVSDQNPRNSCLHVSPGTWGLNRGVNDVMHWTPDVQTSNRYEASPTTSSTVQPPQFCASCPRLYVTCKERCDEICCLGRSDEEH
jgi:hypothetical protein